MEVVLEISRFTVMNGSREMGVCIRRSDGWVFVPNTSPFQVCVGLTPEEAVMSSGMALAQIK